LVLDGGVVFSSEATQKSKNKAWRRVLSRATPRFSEIPIFPLSLQQIQLAGAGYGFSAPLNLQFVINSAAVPFNRVQGEEKPLTDLTI
jgi:hypothetical protein